MPDLCCLFFFPFFPFPSGHLLLYPKAHGFHDGCTEDRLLVIEIVGVKFFINEFVAFQQLSQYKNKRLSGIEEWINGEKQWISVSDNPANYRARGLGQAYLREGTACHINIVGLQMFLSVPA